MNITRFHYVSFDFLWKAERMIELIANLFDNFVVNFFGHFDVKKSNTLHFVLQKICVSNRTYKPLGRKQRWTW